MPSAPAWTWPTLPPCVCRRAVITLPEQIQHPAPEEGDPAQTLALQHSLRKWTPRLRVPGPLSEPQIQGKAPVPKLWESRGCWVLVLCWGVTHEEFLLAVLEVLILFILQLLQVPSLYSGNLSSPTIMTSSPSAAFPHAEVWWLGISGDMTYSQSHLTSLEFGLMCQ